jgi:hypothetical protein
MTAKIYLDSQTTEQTLMRLRRTAEDLFDCADRLYLRCACMEWDGASKDAFLYQLHRCTSTLKVLSDSLDLLGFQGAQETEQWQEISSFFTS